MAAATAETVVMAAATAETVVMAAATDTRHSPSEW
jgi:hypothetical protein